MSSDLQSAVQDILLNNEASVAMVTVVAYDYLVTFPREVEHIWSQRWTWVTLLYFLVRYVGIYAAMGIALLGTTFLPGPQKVGTGLIYSAQWAYLVFLGASDLLMILRVWVMWKRSKIILGTLLFFYVAEVVVQIIGSAVFDNPRTDATIIINQVLDYTTCTEVLTVLSPYLTFTLVNPFLFDVLLVVLALISTVKDSMALYRETNIWQPNRYMSLIVKEGVFYIILNMVNTVTVVVSQVHTGALPPTWVVIFGLFGIATLYPVVPRFVLGIRELYEKECRDGIDGGFGVSSSDQRDDSLGLDTNMSELAFAEGQSSEGEVGDEEMHIGPVLKREDR